MNILTIISPLIIVALTGYITAKKQWLIKEQFDVISKITFQLFIPAFLFYQMAHANLSDQLNPKVLTAFYLPVLFCYGLAWIINFYQHSPSKSYKGSATYALSASYSNNVIVGIPVLLMIIGEQALPTIFMVITFHSAMLFGLTGILAAKSQQFQLLPFLKQTFYNPFILAILIGLLFNLLNIELPDFIKESLILLGKPAITLALFVLGASLAQYQIKKAWQFTMLASGIKLILLPSIVFLTATQLFQLSQQTSIILTVLASCPTGVNAYLIAKNYQSHQGTVASTVVISTLLSVLTIPLWLWWLTS